MRHRHDPTLPIAAIAASIISAAAATGFGPSSPVEALPPPDPTDEAVPSLPVTRPADETPSPDASDEPAPASPVIVRVEVVREDPTGRWHDAGVLEGVGVDQFTRCPAPHWSVPDVCGLSTARTDADGQAMFVATSDLDWTSVGVHDLPQGYVVVGENVARAPGHAFVAGFGVALTFQVTFGPQPAPGEECAENRSGPRVSSVSTPDGIDVVTD